MVTITLEPVLEQIVTEQARQQGTTPELLIQNVIRQKYLPALDLESPSNGQNMADFLKDYIGCIDSSEIYPEGSYLSEDTGRKFSELLLEKRKQGKL